MEVYIHDLPSEGDFTPQGLSFQLQPYMHPLGISDRAYRCEKPRWRRYGFITFLNRLDAEKFLSVHGEIPRPGKPASRLSLHGAQVLCKASTKDPDPITLRALSAAIEQEAETSTDKAPDTSISFQLNGLSCGHYAYVQGQLTFFPEVEWETSGIAKFANRNIIIKLPAERQIRIPLNTIIELVWSPRGSVTLTLSAAPLFFSDDLSVEALVARRLNINPPGPTRMRLTSLSDKHSYVMGICLVYHLDVVNTDMHHKMGILEGRDVLTVSRFNISVQRSADPRLGEISRGIDRLKGMMADFGSRSLLPFEILFQLQALVYNGYLHPSTVVALAKELARISEMDRAAGRETISVDAMKKLFGAIDWPSPQGDPEELEVGPLVEYLKTAQREVQDGVAIRAQLHPPGQGLARISRVLVTPSRITLHGPEMEAMNRILRKFPNNHAYFIRVQFCDENGQDLRFSPKVDYDKVYGRFKSVLKNGIQIAGRTYTFLGWSHSSLKSRTVWFVAPFMDDANNLQTHFTIIQKLGDFGHIFSPAKFAARIGQAFSETPFFLPLIEEEIHVTQIPDVVSTDRTRVFSDGIGTMSQLAMEATWAHLPPKKSAPTCLQIRLAGSKGMLALDSNLSGKQICIRPSMTKFESHDTHNLEICDMATRPIPLVLNRQMIKILEDMGVCEDWFLGLQQRALDELREVTANADNTANFLQRHFIAGSMRLHKLLRLADRQGFDYRKDRFLRSVVEALILRELRRLKHKARIPVKYGVTLFGVMDETEFLQEGEVYVTFDSSAKSKRYERPPGPGPILVTRSPALNPGDIQLPSNVIPPEDHPLRDLANCVVFSGKGSRDLPSQLSGGDLDGDIYNVIWDLHAVKNDSGSLIQTFKPADYPRPAPINIGRSVTRDDMADFFVNFMETDQLGPIATRHMILADQRKEGTRDKDCIALAEMHSTAVDFSKTGIPVDMKKLPRCNKFRPDFLAPGPISKLHDKFEIELEQNVVPLEEDEDDAEGPTHEYYTSKKVLGKLYRSVNERKIWYDDIRIAVSKGGMSFWDSFLQWTLEKCESFGTVTWMHRSEEARRIQSAYEDAMHAAMVNFSEHPVQPLSELEVFIGYIINKTGVQTSRQREQSYKLRDEFDRISTWITRQMRPKSSLEPTEYAAELDNLERCLACVYVTIAPDDAKQDVSRRARWSRKSDELRSFRLVAALALMQEIDQLEGEEQWQAWSWQPPRGRFS